MKEVNKFLRWVDSKETLPPLTVTPALFAAIDHILRQMRMHRNRICEDQSIESFLSYVHARAGIIELMSLYNAIGSHGSTAQQKQWEDEYLRREKSLGSFLRSTARHPVLHVLRGWVRRKREPLDKEMAALVKAHIDDIVSHRPGRTKQAPDPVASMVKQHYRRSEKIRHKCDQAPFVLPAKVASLLPKGLRAQAQSYARSLGLAGYAVPLVMDLGLEIGSYIPDAYRPVREALEKYLHYGVETEQSVSKMVVARNKVAKKNGYASFAHWQLDGTTVASPRRAMGALASALERMGPAYSRLSEAVGRQMRRSGLDVGEPTELDVYHCMQKLYDCGYYEPKNAFPVASTLRKAVPELLAHCGWGVHSVRKLDTASPGWCWDIYSKSGDRATLLVFPQVRRNPGDMTTGSNNAVRGVVRETGNSLGMCVINLSYDQPTGFLDTTSLATLCHEIGHALHALVRPPNNRVDPFDVCGWDMIELPSQVLEAYARDARALARWANPSSHPQANTPEFWQGLLVQTLYTLPDHVRSMMSAWSDISVHAVRNEEGASVWEHFRKGLERFRLPLHYCPQLPYHKFQWDDYAGYYFSYPLGEALSLYFRAQAQGGPSADGPAIAGAFSSLMDEVFSKATDYKTLKKAMEDYTGMGFGELIQVAMSQYGKFVAAKMRAAARQIDLMEP